MKHRKASLGDNFVQGLTDMGAIYHLEAKYLTAVANLIKENNLSQALPDRMRSRSLSSRIAFELVRRFLLKNKLRLSLDCFQSEFLKQGQDDGAALMQRMQLKNQNDPLGELLYIMQNTKRHQYHHPKLVQALMAKVPHLLNDETKAYLNNIIQRASIAMDKKINNQQMPDKKSKRDVQSDSASYDLNSQSFDDKEVKLSPINKVSKANYDESSSSSSPEFGSDNFKSDSDQEDGIQLNATGSSGSPSLNSEQPFDSPDIVKTHIKQPILIYDSTSSNDQEKPKKKTKNILLNINLNLNKKKGTANIVGSPNQQEALNYEERNATPSFASLEKNSKPNIKNQKYVKPKILIGDEQNVKPRAPIEDNRYASDSSSSESDFEKNQQPVITPGSKSPGARSIKPSQITATAILLPDKDDYQKISSSYGSDEEEEEEEYYSPPHPSKPHPQEKMVILSQSSSPSSGLSPGLNVSSSDQSLSVNSPQKELSESETSSEEQNEYENDQFEEESENERSSEDEDEKSDDSDHQNEIESTDDDSESYEETGSSNEISSSAATETSDAIFIQPRIQISTTPSVPQKKALPNKDKIQRREPSKHKIIKKKRKTKRIITKLIRKPKKAQLVSTEVQTRVGDDATKSPRQFLTSPLPSPSREKSHKLSLVPRSPDKFIKKQNDETASINVSQVGSTSLSSLPFLQAIQDRNMDLSSSDDSSLFENFVFSDLKNKPNEVSPEETSESKTQLSIAFSGNSLSLPSSTTTGISIIDKNYEPRKRDVQPMTNTLASLLNYRQRILSEESSSLTIDENEEEEKVKEKTIDIGKEKSEKHPLAVSKPEAFQIDAIISEKASSIKSKPKSASKSKSESSSYVSSPKSSEYEYSSKVENESDYYTESSYEKTENENSESSEYYYESESESSESESYSQVSAQKVESESSSEKQSSSYEVDSSLNERESIKPIKKDEPETSERSRSKETVSDIKSLSMSTPKYLSSNGPIKSEKEIQVKSRKISKHKKDDKAEKPKKHKAKKSETTSEYSSQKAKPNLESSKTSSPVSEISSQFSPTSSENKIAEKEIVKHKKASKHDDKPDKNNTKKKIKKVEIEQTESLTESSHTKSDLSKEFTKKKSSAISSSSKDDQPINRHANISQEEEDNNYSPSSYTPQLTEAGAYSKSSSYTKSQTQTYSKSVSFSEKSSNKQTSEATSGSSNHKIQTSSYTVSEDAQTSASPIFNKQKKLKNVAKETSSDEGPSTSASKRSSSTNKSKKESSTETSSSTNKSKRKSSTEQYESNSSTGGSREYSSSDESSQEYSESYESSQTTEQTTETSQYSTEYSYSTANESSETEQSQQSSTYSNGYYSSEDDDSSNNKRETEEKSETTEATSSPESSFPNKDYPNELIDSIKYKISPDRKNSFSTTTKSKKSTSENRSSSTNKSSDNQYTTSSYESSSKRSSSTQKSEDSSSKQYSNYSYTASTKTSKGDSSLTERNISASSKPESESYSNYSNSTSTKTSRTGSYSYTSEKNSSNTESGQYSRYSSYAETSQKSETSSSKPESEKYSKNSSYTETTQTSEPTSSKPESEQYSKYSSYTETNSSKPKSEQYSKYSTSSESESSSSNTKSAQYSNYSSSTVHHKSNKSSSNQESKEYSGYSSNDYSEDSSTQTQSEQYSNYSSSGASNHKSEDNSYYSTSKKKSGKSYSKTTKSSSSGGSSSDEEYSYDSDSDSYESSESTPPRSKRRTKRRPKKYYESDYYSSPYYSSDSRYERKPKYHKNKQRSQIRLRVDRAQFEKLYPNGLQNQPIVLSKKGFDLISNMIQQTNQLPSPVQQQVQQPVEKQHVDVMTSAPASQDLGGSSKKRVKKSESKKYTPKEIKERDVQGTTMTIVTTGPHAGLIKRRIKKADHQADIAKKLQEKAEYARILQEELDRKREEENLKVEKATETSNVEPVVPIIQERALPSTIPSNEAKKRKASPLRSTRKARKVAISSTSKRIKQNYLRTHNIDNMSSISEPQSISVDSEIHPENMSKEQRRAKRKEIQEKIKLLREELNRPVDMEARRRKRAKIEAKIEILQEEFEKSSDENEKSEKKKKIESNMNKLKQQDITSLNASQRRKKRHEIEQEIEKLHNMLQNVSDDEPNKRQPLPRRLVAREQKKSIQSNQAQAKQLNNLKKADNLNGDHYSSVSSGQDISPIIRTPQFLENQKKSDEESSQKDVYHVNDFLSDSSSIQERRKIPPLKVDIPKKDGKADFFKKHYESRSSSSSKSENEQQPQYQILMNAGQANMVRGHDYKAHQIHIKKRPPLNNNINNNNNDEVAIQPPKIDNDFGLPIPPPNISFSLSQLNVSPSGSIGHLKSPRPELPEGFYQYHDFTQHNVNFSLGRNQNIKDNIYKVRRRYKVKKKDGSRQPSPNKDESKTGDGKRKIKKKIPIEDTNINQKESADNEKNPHEGSLQSFIHEISPKPEGATLADYLGDISSDDTSDIKQNESDDGKELSISSKSNRSKEEIPDSEKSLTFSTSTSSTTKQNQALNAKKYSVSVKVIEALDIPLLDSSDEYDPYCLLFIEGETNAKRTKAIEKTSTPIWNEDFTFLMNEVSTNLIVQLKDQDVASDDIVLSSVTINLIQFPLDQQIEQWFALRSMSGDYHGGRVHMIIKRSLISTSDQDDQQYKIYDNNKQLQNLSFGYQINEKTMPKLRLNIMIDQGKDLPTCNQYCVAKIRASDGLAKTRPLNSPHPNWHESFKLKLPNPKNDVLLLTLRTKDSKNGDDDIANCSIPVSSIPIGKCVEDWFEFKSVAQRNNVVGSVHMKLKTELDSDDSKLKFTSSTSGANSSATQSSNIGSPQKSNEYYGNYEKSILDLTIVEGKNLQQSTYVIIKLDNGHKETYRTRTIDDTNSPAWNEKFHFSINPYKSVLIFKLRNSKNDEDLGTLRVNLTDLKILPNQTLSKWFALSPTSAGKLLLKFSLEQPSNANSLNSNFEKNNSEDPIIVVDVSSSESDIDSSSYDKKDGHKSASQSSSQRKGVKKQNKRRKIKK